MRAAGHLWRGVCAGASSEQPATPYASASALCTPIFRWRECSTAAAHAPIPSTRCTQVLDAATWGMSIPEPEAQVHIWGREGSQPS